MPTAIEVSSSAIRLCQVEGGRLIACESWPVAADADPLQVLAGAPLPDGLGKVRVVLQHDDMLLRPMVQPPCPPDRLDRIVRFELQSGGGAGEGADPIAISWHKVEGLSGDDFRILALITKQRLVSQVGAALANRGASTAAIVPPALGLYHAWKAQEGADQSQAILIDIGGKRLHLAFVDGGQPVFLRSVAPGLDDLVAKIAELRSLAEPDARALVAGLGAKMPDDIKSLIEKQAGQVAAAIANNLRYAKAQLKLDNFEAKAIWISGAGGQVPGLVAELAKRQGVPARLINPFAGLTSAVPTDRLDAAAALPSPWAPVLGAAQASSFILDGLAEAREQRARFWATDGALRVGAIAAVLIIALGLAAAWTARGAAIEAAGEGTTPGRLGDLVTQAKAVQGQAKAATVQTEQAAAGVRWLDEERRAGRVATEIVAAIAAEQDPATRHVALTHLRVVKVAGSVQVELNGLAKAAAGLTSDRVLAAFEDGLRRRYADASGKSLITQVERRPMGIAPGGAGMPFSFLLTVADRAD
jgi:hypothetical protein